MTPRSLVRAAALTAAVASAASCAGRPAPAVLPTPAVPPAVVIAAVPGGGADSVVGTVRDRRTREPLPGVLVYLFYTGFGDTTDASGRFAFRPPAPGAYELRLRRFGYQGAADSLTVRAGVTLRIEATLKQYGDDRDIGTPIP